jgi:hypothetical protein
MATGDAVGVEGAQASQVWNGYIPYATYRDPKEKRLQDLYYFVNTMGHSSYVDVRPVLREIASILGLPEGSIIG